VAELSSEQRAFLAANGIALSTVFDATGMRKTDYQDAMEELGKSFAYGVTPCRRSMHTLRTRAGHCIQCDPAKIAFMLRYDSSGLVYIAGSEAGRLIKVGSSGDIEQRRGTLNDLCYGGQRDWQILASAKCGAAGRIEFAVHSKLAPFATSGHYFRGAKKQNCYELFRCDFVDAQDALKSELPDGSRLNVKDVERSTALFRFRTT
jgi:hypothetical protein